MKKRLLKISLLFFIPVVVSIFTNYLLKFPTLLILGICYFVLFLIFVPTGNFSSTGLDYETKINNPHYRPAKKENIVTTKFDIIKILSLLLAALLSFYFFYNT